MPLRLHKPHSFKPSHMQPFDSRSCVICWKATFYASLPPVTVLKFRALFSDPPLCDAKCFIIITKAMISFRLLDRTITYKETVHTMLGVKCNGVSSFLGPYLYRCMPFWARYSFHRLLRKSNVDFCTLHFLQLEAKTWSDHWRNTFWSQSVGRPHNENYPSWTLNPALRELLSTRIAWGVETVINIDSKLKWISKMFG